MKKLLITLAVAALFSGPALAGPVQTGTATADLAADVTVTNTGPSYTTNHPGKQDIDMKNVPDVSAPGLTTTMTETCMGSTSGGVAWLGFGITGGTTWRDGRCANRLDARQWGQFAVQVKEPRFVLVGVELLCENKANQRAAARAGVICGEQDDDAPVADTDRPAPKAPEDRRVSVESQGLPEWFAANE